MPDSTFRAWHRSILRESLSAKWPRHLRDLLDYSGDGDERVYPIWRKTLMAGEFDHLAQFVDPAKAAIDVGALLGQYSLTLAALSARCLCIEPLEKYAFLAKLLPGNCKHCTIAAGDVAGHGVMHTPDHNYGLSSLLDTAWLHGAEIVTEQITRIERLDDIVVRELPDVLIGFVKIDVEGYELNVLNGATELLLRHRPNLQIEISPDTLPAVCALLADMGYIGLFFFEGRLHAIDQFRPELHLNPAHAWTPETAAQFDIERYVVNFFFVPTN